MALTKVWIKEGCICCGLCGTGCSQVFAMPELAEAKPGGDYGAFEALIKEAAAACPAKVITYEESGEVTWPGSHSRPLAGWTYSFSRRPFFVDIRQN